MKAVQIVKPNELRIIDMPKPEINEHDDVLVKIKASGICGSDVGIYHGTNAAATYPRVIGHEIVGEIVEVGSNVKTLDYQLARCCQPIYGDKVFGFVRLP